MNWRVIVESLKWQMRRLFCLPLLSCLIGWLSVGGLAGSVLGQDDPVRVDYLGDPLPAGALLRLGTVRFSPGPIYYSIVSADDQVVVNLGPQTCGWDAATGRRLWSLDVERNQFQTAFMTSAASYGYQPLVRMPKSNRFLFSKANGQFVFVNFLTGESEPAFKADFKQQICAVDVNPDETLFAIGTPRELIVCDTSGTTIYKVANKPDKQIDQAADERDRLKFGGEFSYARFSADGNSLVLVNSEQPKTLQVLDLQGNELKNIPTTDRIVRFDFAPGGQFLATTERDIAARLYDLKSGSMVWERVFSPAGRDERYTTDIRFSPDGNLLAVGTAIGEDQRIHLLDPSNGETLGTLAGHTWKPWCVNFSSDGKRLFSSGWDSVIRVWDVERREQIRVENSERASSVCTLTQDGRLLAYGDDSGKIHVVESRTGEKLRTISVDGHSFSQLAFAADGKTLAAGGSSEQVIAVFVWNLDQDEPLHQWAWPKGQDVHSSVESMSFIPDGKRLAVAVFRQSKCFVFDLPSDRQVAELRHGGIYGLGLHPDGEQVVTAGWDSKVRVWNVETGEVVHEREHEIALPGRDARMYGVKFSPDQNRIATLNMSNSVSILDLELNLIREIQVNGSPSYDCFEFSKNGLWLAVGLYDGSACVIDVHTGEMLWQRQCHQKGIYNIEFGPDDRSLLTGGTDGVNYLWDLNQSSEPADADCREIADRLLTGDGLAAFNAFQYLATRPSDALPAIVESVEKLFSTFESVDQERADFVVQRLFRDELIGEAELNQITMLDLGTAYTIEQILSEQVATLDDSDLRVQNLQSFRAYLDRRLWSLSRAFYLVAILDNTDAEQQLQQWLTTGPKLNIKKQVFLAKKYRDLWHRRTGIGEK